MASALLSLPLTVSHKKKIVICCDGTGNDFGSPNCVAGDKTTGRNSNVVKLYTVLQIDNEQVGYYHPGVGTMGAPTATHWWGRWWSKVKGLAFGAGFRDNVLDAYRYLMEVYNDNGGYGNEDEVYIFGFSRGAYTARALAGFLNGYGLLCRGNEGHIPYAWRMYVKQHDDRARRSVEPDKAFMETFSHKGFKIQFIGVWDTVSSVGWIMSPLRLFNLAQNESIVRGRHAISIDEHRCFFQDNLWGDPLPGQDLVQVWFAGVHSDVGGSYIQPDSELSYTTLRWMLDEVGQLPDAQGNYPPGLGVRLNPAHYDLIFGKLPTPVVDREVLYEPPTSQKLHNSLTGAWWILEFIPHLYYNMDDKMEKRRVPLGLRRRQLPPGSLVDRSVVERMEHEDLKYKPTNVLRTELTPRTDDPAPILVEGKYYLFSPRDRTKSGELFKVFDRYILTWGFGLFDVFILIPLFVWIVLLIGSSIGVLSKVVVLFLWSVAPTWMRCPFHILVHWLSFLWRLLLDYLACLRHVV
jgi:Uncharacterized alpha/beta hydrolase domain (DUF2235)